MRWRRLLGIRPADVPRTPVKSLDRRVAEHVAARFGALGWDEFPWWAEQRDGAPGLDVNRDIALSVPAVLRGRNLICGTLSTLPILVTDGDNQPQTVPLFEQIDPDVPNVVTMAQTVEDLLFDAISWWRVTQRAGGYPVHAQHVDVDNVTFQMPAQFPLNRLPSGYYPGSHIFVLSSMEAVPARDMIRFDSPLPALLRYGSRAIRRALTLERTADRYAENPQVREYFTPKDDYMPAPATDEDDEDTAIQDLLDAWIAARQLRTTGFVPAGFELKSSEQPSPVDLQLASLIEKATIGLANLMGLDPEDFGVSTTSRTYQNQVDRRQDRINECYAPYASAVTDRLSMGDITRPGHVVNLDWSVFLRANPLDRSEVQGRYIEMGVLLPEEVREQERVPAYTAAQRAEAAAIREDAAPGGARLATVTRLRPAAGFAADEPATLVFDGGPALTIDEKRRTITGLVVPWGEIGRAQGARWRFARGALQYNPGLVNRIKLMEDHGQFAVRGKALRTWADDAGQWATFRVARGPDGDRVLAEAADGIRDGFSVGIGWESEPDSIKWVPDPADPTVRLIVSAPWRETSILALPAFDSARVSAVTMAADPPIRGVPMPDVEPQAPAAAPDINQTVQAAIAAAFAAERTAQADAAAQAAAAQNDAAAQAAALDARIGTAVAAAFGAYEQAQQATGPTQVNPVRPGEAARVTEQPLYRFDGKKAQRCFTSDIAAQAFKADPVLREKAEAFLAESMSLAFANITPTNVASLNPAIQRPDLWVPALHFARPIGEMMTGGVVDSLTQQTLPKFSASAGLAQGHTTGTEPADGSFSTTSQNITPAPISGRVTIDREVIDQGGTPQTDQVIWNEMTQYYATLLETRAVDCFQALGLDDIDIVGVDGDLQAALLTEFAALQFVKGGDRYRGFAVNQDLYTAITTAKDSTGRSLFPMFQPQNAAGSVAASMASVMVGTKIGVPAWALATANSGPAKSFLFVPESCYQWFSPPRRIDLDAIAVATVAIGIWGYSAEFVTRDSDIIQLAYAES